MPHDWDEYAEAVQSTPETVLWHVADAVALEPLSDRPAAEWRGGISYRLDLLRRDVERHERPPSAEGVAAVFALAVTLLELDAWLRAPSRTLERDEAVGASVDAMLRTLRGDDVGRLRGAGASGPALGLVISTCLLYTSPSPRDS